MALSSQTFRGDQKLEACLVSDPAHVTPGATGEHVAKLQTALMMLDGAKIDGSETLRKTYGSSTAAAVLAYKTKRRIVNPAYQTKPDNIVGKMTIAALDREMLQFERNLRDFNSCSGKRTQSTPR
jgi:peptidoglycan hydrolase-like protein with peptidoglycan-binding domain